MTEGASRTALILAAGRGSRLVPITDHTPKPLVPFLGVPVVEVAARQLVRAGISRIAINAFHLSDQLAAFVHGHLAQVFPEVEWKVSREPHLAGTGGAVVLLKQWLQEDPAGFWIANSDAVHAADLAAMEKCHRRRQADATMLVTRQGSFDVPRNVEIDAEGLLLRLLPPHELGERFTGVGGTTRVAYCGWMRVQPELADILPPVKEPSCTIRQGLLPWRAAGAVIATYQTPNFSADLGTPERYLRAHRDGLAALVELADTGALPAPRKTTPSESFSPA